MKYSILFLLLLTACGGSLTDEQRKKLKEGMELNSIKKVSDAQITEAAFIMGRSLSTILERATGNKDKLIDSLQKKFKVRIYNLQPNDSMLLSVENQLVEAYTSGTGNSTSDDNIQRLGTDTLLYTKPIMKELANGSREFSYALGIRLPRKQVVLSIKD